MSAIRLTVAPLRCTRGHAWASLNSNGPDGKPWEYCRRWRCDASRERPLFLRELHTRVDNDTWSRLMESAGGDSSIASWIRGAIAMRLEAEAAVEDEAIEA